MQLINLLPDYYRQNKTMELVQELLSAQAGLMEIELSNAVDNCFPSSASSLLSRYEKIFGLPIDAGQKNEFRRERIMAKISGTGTTTKAMIQDVASRYSNGDVEIEEDNANHRFTVHFVGQLGIPGNMDALKMTIEEIKPAHLEVSYEYVYNTWDDIKTRTWTQAHGLTWDGIRTVTL